VARKFQRWYVGLPVALSVALIVSTYYLIERGESRLRKSTAEAQYVQERLRNLGAILRVLTDAESTMRGYLLSGEVQYLESFRLAEQELEPALNAVREQYPTATETEWLDSLARLSREKIATLRQTLSVHHTEGAQAAQAMIRADVSRNAMDRIRPLIRERQLAEGQTLRAISESSRYDLLITRAYTIGGTWLNLVLIVLASVLITRAIEQHESERRALTDQRAELERQVEARTAELSALSSRLQEISETEKAAMAREIHDELGSLLVAAKMDVSALRRRLGPEDAEVRARWERLMGALDAGVNLKRRMVEQLRPTLLDNMGLYAALRWHLHETCARAGLQCTDSLPDDEPALRNEANIAIFRIAQEAITNILKHARATAIELAIVIAGEELIMTICDDGIGISADRRTAAGGQGWASMRHRMRALGGSWHVRDGPGGRGTAIEVRLPLSRIQVAAAPLLA
jgi:signal transduction histidine kinase